ncbi:GTP pyrophosphokinase family protein [Chryseobacterium sp. FH1]|uniref:GTP pyrophosphokinase n=1 Tax=Chryseobacterium sp. FH1 TaxID=1233951 RepID=UPI00068A1634|nr:hypothetical protein [Chryseobacterium sp. FH1]
MDTKIIKSELIKHTLFTNHLKSLVESLLVANNIKFHIIESRTKDSDSLVEKIERKQIKDLNEITDLSGIRIIVYYQDDIDKIERIVRDNFIVDEPNSINKSELYKSNEFGYLSVHYIITLNNDREKLAEWKNFSKLKAEIQVRTVLQHSWASISHELSYKKNYEIPKEIERKLYRLAGLFELADEQFLEIREDHTKIFNELRKIDGDNKIEFEDINLITLTYLFTEDNRLDIFNSIYDVAINAGFIDNDDSNSKQFLSEILRIAKILNLKNLKELVETLIKNEALYLEYFNKLISMNESDNWFGTLEFFVGLALMLDFNNDQILEYKQIANKWGDKILKQVLESIVEVKKL